jgi:hypothetical protein
MNALDAELSRIIRRELSKRPMDITRIDIQCTNGRVSIGGIVTNLRDQPTINLRDEMSIVDKMLARNQLVRQYSNMARLIQIGEGDDQEQGSARGRMRPHHA